MDIAEAMRSLDMDEVIDAMNAYATSCLWDVDLKDFNGKEPIDLVGDLILKVAEGKRDWGKAKCTFREFLFGCLRSDIDSFFKTNKTIHTDKLPNSQTNGTPHDLTEEKNKISELLKQAGADEVEMEVFKCWMDGITKPSEIEEELKIDIKIIYKAIKRLERKRSKLQEQAKYLI